MFPLPYCNISHFLVLFLCLNLTLLYYYFVVVVFKTVVYCKTFWMCSKERGNEVETLTFGIS